ncbi:hypothetical protein ElyMa_003650200 [Elysia marginata]|uniref:Uncharacterized protein n=1 Tax=Elysia marginata TaxID=1093978 RepID=A0AAV4EWW6_9GAST|nr:hypothetical protein ElyMa_003650200 [Elysia marginata]
MTDRDCRPAAALDLIFKSTTFLGCIKGGEFVDRCIDSDTSQPDYLGTDTSREQFLCIMKGFTAAVLCLCLLVSVVNCQTPPPDTCTQVCTQVCDIWSNIMSVWSVFFAPLAPFVIAGYSICTNGCGWGCSLIG